MEATKPNCRLLHIKWISFPIHSPTKPKKVLRASYVRTHSRVSRNSPRARSEQDTGPRANRNGHESLVLPSRGPQREPSPAFRENRPQSARGLVVLPRGGAPRRETRVHKQPQSPGRREKKCGASGGRQGLPSCSLRAGRASPCCGPPPAVAATRELRPWLRGP